MRTDFSRWLVVWLAAFVAIAVPTFAEDESDGDAAMRLPEEEVRAGRIHESLDDPPVFVEIIDMADFEGRAVTTEEVVRQAAGVSVRDFGGLGKLSTVSIRGSSADQVVVLVDGVRLNPAAGGGVDFSSIPAEQIERIEVIRGGDSAFFGEGAVGGVVNIVTKKAGRGARTTAEISYGSFGTVRMSASTSRGTDRDSYLFSANVLHTDGDFEFSNNNGTEFNEDDDFADTRSNNETDSQSLLGKGAMRIGDHVVVSAQNELFHARKGLPGILTAPSSRTHQEDVRNTVSAGATIIDLGVRGLSFDTRVSYRYSSIEYDDPDGEQNAGIPTNTYQEQHAPRIEETIAYVWGNHQIWTLAASYAHTRLDDASFDHPTRDTWAVALRDQIMLWDGRITILPAVRYDDVSGQGNQWSPKLGLHFQPLDWLVLKGNGGFSFRAPNFSELYFSRGFVEGNPDLKPERGFSVDAGLQVRTKWFSVEGAYFRNQLDDLIEYLLISGFRFKPFNISKALLQGAELILRVHPIRYVELTANYTITYAIDETGERNRDGNQIPGRPRNQLFASLRLSYGPASVFGEYHYIEGNFVTRANTKLLDPRQIVNAGATVDIKEKIRLGLEMKNALDDDVVDVRGFPLPGRSMFGTIKVTF